MPQTKEQKAEKRHEYYMANLQRHKEYGQKYWAEHREEKLEQQRIRRAQKFSEDPVGEREKQRAATRKWRVENPKKVRAQVLRATSELTLAEYDTMFFSQGGLCAICGELNQGGRMMSVDHDHKTGRVRGLLCIKCNSILGYANDNQSTLKSAVEYLSERG